MLIELEKNNFKEAISVKTQKYGRGGRLNVKIILFHGDNL
jgi:hypothetical protein